MIFVKLSSAYNSIFIKSSSKKVVFSYIVYEQYYFVKNFNHMWYLIILALKSKGSTMGKYPIYDISCVCNETLTTSELQILVGLRI